MSVHVLMVEVSFSDTSQSTKLNGIISHKTVVFVFTVVVTPNLSVARVQVVIEDIYDIQEYRCRRYLAEQGQLNNITLQFLPHSKQTTIYFTKISWLIMFAKIRNVLAVLNKFNLAVLSL